MDLDVSVFPGWLFENEAVSLSSLTLSLPPGTDCKKILSLVNYLFKNLWQIFYLIFFFYVSVLFR